MTPQTRTARALALAATSLGFGVVQLDVSVVNVAIEPIRRDFGGPISGVQWVVSAYTIVFAALILSAGSIGDRLGAKRIFVAGFGLFTLASLACGLAPDLPALIAFRALQGIGAAALVPNSLSLLNHAYDEPAERARAVGLWAAGASVGLSGGPVIGGLLTAALGWRWVFFINLPLGLLGIALTLRYAGETSRSPERAIDPPGQLLGVAALALLAGSAIEGGRRGFADPLVLSGFLLAAAFIAGFVRTESRRPHPMLPLGLFADRVFAGASAIGLVINVAFYGLIFVLSLYFQSAKGYSALRTGLAFAPMTGIVLLANVWSSRLTARAGARIVIVGSAIGMAAGLAGLAGLLGEGAHASYAVLVGPSVLVGFALGLIVPAMTSALLGSVDRSRSGVASGTLNTARQTGSVLGVSLFGALAATGIVAGLRASLGVSIGLGVVTAIVGASLLPGRKLRSEKG